MDALRLGLDNVSGSNLKERDGDESDDPTARFMSKLAKDWACWVLGAHTGEFRHRGMAIAEALAAYGELFDEQSKK